MLSLFPEILAQLILSEEADRIQTKMISVKDLSKLNAWTNNTESGST